MKKKTTLKVLSLTGLLAIAGTSLASCGGGSHQFDVDMTVDTRGVSIDFWSGFGANVNKVLEPILEEFTAETGIIVNYESKGGYDNLQTAISLSASTTTYPNITLGYPDHFAGYINSDIQLRLDGFIEHDKDIPATRNGTVADPEAEGTFTELEPFEIDSFYDTYMTENRNLEFDENGKGYTLGIPFNKSTEVMVYNKTFFDNEFVKTEGIKVPETWDEVKTVGEKILNMVKTKGVYGKLLGSDNTVYDAESDMPDGVNQILDLTSVTEGDLYPLSYDSTANIFITGIRQWGGEYTEIDKTTRKGYIKFDNQATRDSMNAMKAIYDVHGYAIPATFGESSYCSAHFKIYKSLMNIGSSAGVINCNPAGSKFETACAPIPYHDADHKYVISQGTNLCLLDKGNDAEKVASWKLLKYLSQIKNGEFAAGTGYFPACEKAANSKVYQEFLNSTKGGADDKVNRSAAKVNAEVYTAANGWNKFVDPGFNGSSTVRTSVTSIPAQVFIDNANIDDVIAAQYKTLSDYVR
ncbi:MAG: extracellular solute-binding protein [Bacilli bacterium]|nr:extracellular solute-binding protein [Bacilli bacterium]